jgi:hypothetical protein
MLIIDEKTGEIKLKTVIDSALIGTEDLNSFFKKTPDMAKGWILAVSFLNFISLIQENKLYEAKEIRDWVERNLGFFFEKLEDGGYALSRSIKTN